MLFYAGMVRCGLVGGALCPIHIVSGSFSAKLFKYLGDVSGIRAVLHISYSKELAVRAVLFLCVLDPSLECGLKFVGSNALGLVIGTDVYDDKICLACKIVFVGRILAVAGVAVAEGNTGSTAADTLTRKSGKGVIRVKCLSEEIGIAEGSVLRGVLTVKGADSTPSAGNAVSDELDVKILVSRCFFGDDTRKLYGRERRESERVARDLDHADVVSSLGKVLDKDLALAGDIKIRRLTVHIGLAVNVSAEICALVVGLNREGHITLTGCGEFDTRCAPVSVDCGIGGEVTNAEDLDALGVLVESHGLFCENYGCLCGFGSLGRLGSKSGISGSLSGFLRISVTCGHKHCSRKHKHCHNTG